MGLYGFLELSGLGLAVFHDTLPFHDPGHEPPAGGCGAGYKHGIGPADGPLCWPDGPLPIVAPGRVPYVAPASSGNAQLDAVRESAARACVYPASPECGEARAAASVWEAEFAKANAAGPAPVAAAPAPKSAVERWNELKAMISGPAKVAPAPPPVVIEKFLPAPTPEPVAAPEPQVVIMPAAAAGGAVASIALAIGVYLLLKK
jgi:hypothetical protein